MVGEARQLYRGYRHPFVNGRRHIGGVGDSPRTLIDLAMSKLSASLRREQDWWTRFHDPGTRAEWAAKALTSTWAVRTPVNWIEISLSPHQINYVLDELDGYANLRDTQNQCQVACFERIWYSTPFLNEALLVEVDRELSSLREVQMSWDPRVGTTVDIIDPFLHCLVYGRTLAYDSQNSDRVLPEPHLPMYDIENTAAVSKTFACLPTDFAVSSSGAVKALSYINNLHPRHVSLHNCIENLLSKIVPLFEHVLTDLHEDNPMSQRIKTPLKLVTEPEPPEFSDDEQGWAVYESRTREWVMNKPIQLPDVPRAGYAGGLENRRHTVQLKGRTLQVIVRVTDTRLEPNGNDYLGSSWHVEGMKNERIVACAFYYLTVENVIGNAVDFRMAVTSPRGDRGAVLRTYGLDRGDACHQFIGSIPTYTGLCVAFPNIYQVQHMPFRLADPSKEGHQRVLQFFLVDPDIAPIVSTSRIAPQQVEWFMRAVHSSKRFPIELSEKIANDVDGVMNRGEAESYRDVMASERRAYEAVNNFQYFCIPFDTNLDTF
ncbi:hypothetical protein BV22DRAFT_1085358 [Leucogyrophana mollusca]|uniref:Uncharacterized protein n=1 Tax=Leucogyrophana mollusca TaxID=85980 RepID=A0ACB8BPS4_9AGAM|nr:hypothetical protein BV22DRAFT_1085358 [Leucogyrophana mollusca]